MDVYHDLVDDKGLITATGFVLLMKIAELVACWLKIYKSHQASWSSYVARVGVANQPS